MSPVDTMSVGSVGSMKPRLNVRRLAAVDMYGSSGAAWRRWVILLEFVIGTAGIATLGIRVLNAGDIGTVVLGLYLLGVALNYLPLAAYALMFLRPATLRSELAGVDLGGELRRYTNAQFWVFVPLVLLGLDVSQRARRQGESATGRGARWR